jgi:glucose/mannose-6-phosphate isomerase
MAERLDSRGMWDAMMGLPEQMEVALESVTDLSGLPDPATIDHVMILGMGDSGFGGDVAAASARPFSPVPIVVYNGYLPPSWVGPSTLVIAISKSGGTEETLESLEAAVESGASLVAVTGGGELESLARRAGAPVLPVAASDAAANACIGSMSVPAMLALEKLGFFSGARSWVADAVEQLKVRRESFLSDSSPAKQWAEQIGSTIPLVYGGGAIGSTAAKRWKVAVNQNVKRPAFWAPMPDLCHNELSGWASQPEMTSKVFTQLHLRHDNEHPQTARRYEFVAEATEDAMNQIISIEAAGEGPVAQLYDLVFSADITSLELAAADGTDPGPRPMIENMKDWLSSH